MIESVYKKSKRLGSADHSAVNSAVPSLELMNFDLKTVFWRGGGGVGEKAFQRRLWLGFVLEVNIC